ncbi:MAG: amidohydrolase family protein, partial [Acidobacteria bacterium]|nr:amidohydrolase family protein [Acidobacteriota bacterium]
MASELPYMINDADNHFTEPPDCFERYIDPKHADLAVRYVTAPDGRQMQLFAGKPSKFGSSEANQVTFSKDELAAMLGDTTNIGTGRGTVPKEEGERELSTIPGMLLNRLNPLKGLSEDERKAFIQSFRNQSEAFGNRDLRLALMDDQGIDKALMFPAAAHDIEYEFADNIDALYANIRAFNRWMHEEVGYTADGRMFLPPYIAFADPDLAVKELKQVIKDGATIVQTKSGHAHGGRDNPWGGRSLADPVFDEFWNICNSEGINLTCHLGGTDYQKYGADWSEDPNAVFGDFDAFQWMHYWGDRTAMELTSALILHNFFGRFPNIKVCLSELGTVW